MPQLVESVGVRITALIPCRYIKSSESEWGGLDFIGAFSFPTVSKDGGTVRVLLFTVVQGEESEDVKAVNVSCEGVFYGQEVPIRPIGIRVWPLADDRVFCFALVSADLPHPGILTFRVTCQLGDQKATSETRLDVYPASASPPPSIPGLDL